MYKEEVEYTKYHPGYTPPTVRRMKVWDAMWEIDKQHYTVAKVFDHPDKGYRTMDFAKPNCKTTIRVKAYYEI